MIEDSKIIRQKRAEQFLKTGAPYAGAEMLVRYHATGSLEGWILVKEEDPKALYEHTLNGLIF